MVYVLKRNQHATLFDSNECLQYTNGTLFSGEFWQYRKQQ